MGCGLKFKSLLTTEAEKFGGFRQEEEEATPTKMNILIRLVKTVIVIGHERKENKQKFKRMKRD